MAECFKASIRVEFERPKQEAVAERQRQLTQSRAVEYSTRAKATCTTPVDTARSYK